MTINYLRVTIERVVYGGTYRPVELRIEILDDNGQKQNVMEFLREDDLTTGFDRMWEIIGRHIGEGLKKQHETQS